MFNDVFQFWSDFEIDALMQGDRKIEMTTATKKKKEEENTA